MTKNGKLTASKVANQVDVSTKTLTAWYEFYTSDLPKPDNMPELPMYEQAYERAPRYWNPEDIPKIIAFKEWIPRGPHGVMGAINCKSWTLAYREKVKAKKEAKEAEKEKVNE